MFDGLKPDLICRDVLSIDLAALKRMGVRALVFDLDNTLTRWNCYEFSPELIMWMDGCRELGFKVCICSNNHASRIEPVAQALGVPFIADAGKPGKAAYARVRKLLGAKPGRIAAVGDQLMTDIIGAKRNGLRAVLVNPVGGREFIGTYFNRMVERVVMRMMHVRRAPR